MPLTLDGFLKTWKSSSGNERANYQLFLHDFCEVMDLPIPDPKGPNATYCFEKDLKITHLDGSTSTGRIDLFREGCFVLEAKQGSTREAPGASPIRGTRAYEQYLERAFGQAVNYARNLPKRPAFVITCDIGQGFHVWNGFSGTYGGYGARRSFALDELKDPKVREYFRGIWLDPESLDPSRVRTAVTRDVATALGALARSLEARFQPKIVARFLMRVVFTFFAEDIGLLPEKLFQNALEGAWRDHPESFPKGLEALWDAMNTGGFWGPMKVMRFNGGLFQESTALALTPGEISQLAVAAAFDWSEVDPSIFGSLLESALDGKERHRLGAHYTPRAYVERLLRPAVEEPLRADWELAQAEALALLGSEPSDADRAKARQVLHGFQRRLAHITVLDPACGSGNFLATAYDVLKRLEGEIQRRLEDLGETGRSLALEGVLVTPGQFIGLEVKPWAAAITDLVLWISHLQWFHRLHPDMVPPEPVLQAYGNIDCRDAVLTWASMHDTGRTRWDGQTTKLHPVTGLEVPDEAARVPIVELVNPKAATWPEADFIVGNPPFLGNARMRDALGDGYAEALRAAYPEVPDTVDFVLYWWHKAALAVRSGRTRRFGLITTNSLRQVRQRGVIEHHTNEKNPLKLLWAIPDHPWTDDGAAVRIAMTVGGMEGNPWLGRVVEEYKAETPEEEAKMIRVEGQPVAHINEDLSAGAKVAEAIALGSNSLISTRGVCLFGSGFIVTPAQWEAWGRPPVVHPYRHGRDLTDKPRGVMVIDLFGLREEEVRRRYPAVYQHVYDHVKPERDQNNREIRRRNWWLFGEPNPGLHQMLAGLPRFIATVETAKHRVFMFLDGATVPDNMVIAIATADAFHLGVLSSRIHETWALAAGALLGVGNTPRYSKSRCFDPFPFPDATESQKALIRTLAGQLDTHRKAAQERGVTITGMYNLLAKLRSGEAFTPQERAQHEVAQTEILRELHDELNAAVAAAYSWSVDLSVADILSNLVSLNKNRAAEESRGMVRWIRPDYQSSQQTAAVPLFEVEPETSAAAQTQIEPRPWPKELKDQLAALRDVMVGSGNLWSLEMVYQAFRGRGRYRESLVSHIELLTSLGMVSKVDTPQGIRWHRPQAIGA